MHIGGECTDGPCCAAAYTGCQGKRHFKREDCLQDSSSSITIKLVFHHASPVGPNRSVLTRAGSYPNVTRLAAAVSTKGVGPQMNVKGRCSGGQATSRNRSVSIRR